MSSSGFISEIQFSPPAKSGGWLKWPRFGGGKDQRNLFKAVLYRRDDPKKTPIYVVAGQWSGAFTITHCDSGRVIENVDLSAGTPAVPAEILPVEEMDPFETRRAWRPVIEAIRKGDMADTSRHKARLEDAQREKRTVEERNGAKWEPLFFRKLEGKYELFEKLGSATSWPLEQERTDGVWIVDEQKVQKMKRPFRPDSILVE